MINVNKFYCQQQKRLSIVAKYKYKKNKNKIQRFLSRSWLIVDLEKDFIKLNYEKFPSDGYRKKIKNFKHSARLRTES